MRGTLLTLMLLFSMAAIAQPAIYQNETLTIPQGATVIAGKTVYYENIQLRDQGNGNFAVVSAEARDLVGVESVTVDVMESIPAQVSVTVEGNKSVPCVALLTPAVAYANGQFTVTMAESRLGPAETCISVIDPFTTSFDLDVEGFAAGTYGFSVNDVDAEFTLQADN